MLQYRARLVDIEESREEVREVGKARAVKLTGRT